MASSAIHGLFPRRLPTRRRPCGMRKTEDQLGAEPLPLSKIRDGSAERNERPRGAAVFDF